MVNAGRATQQRGTRSATGQDWDESGDWGGTRGAPVPSRFSRPLPLLNLSSSCPSFLGGQLAEETRALFGLQKQQLLRTGFTHPREFNDTLQNSQFSPLRLLLLTPPPHHPEDSDSGAATLNCIFRAKLQKPKQ